MSETRDHLKTIATDQICKNNLAAASFREMGKAAGIKSSSVHYHFKSRDALLLELATDYQHAFFAELQQRTEGITSPRQRLQQLCDLYTEHFTNNRQCLAQAYSAGMNELTEESQTAIHAFYEALFDWVLECLSSARFLPVSREALARVVVSALQGALVADRVGQDAVHLASVREWIGTLTSL
ncbi:MULTISPECIES: TetR/AcrR family transcriptional regulator [Oceanospirillaceae]|uniref:TetR/AcrR family transcriptional regulator n=1 Tax=Oceanobacter antarcticus TaxID=3133425 RepID=A0ABW8NLU3_9GAMM